MRNTNLRAAWPSRTASVAPVTVPNEENVPGRETAGLSSRLGARTRVGLAAAVEQQAKTGKGGCAELGFHSERSHPLADWTN